ncbi:MULTISPECIES: hypothetical protein [unclassified Gilliamella]|uniref:hypothetical protein n=1 Tax=unclassified Gilliamella TaxID=2685620 RepID=UPI00226AA528|nr:MULTISPECIES: hypothetical protein [unclassified Gilliamella]MCX8642411.1 hypothetical protein [Gilliamella sp. B3835]MCX8706261.1 hypothetical protein [Gilliamella sp. B3783]MCX8709599.1 hypothetical protein [Gilliamella sp. B3780]MCX8714328.1 hypothetical protein [Gilliamella sp. B3781]MCX8716993.1 hypothetical protein [Gilliamella sp. B3784]
MQSLKKKLEQQQIAIYFLSVFIAMIVVFCINGTSVFAIAITPALGVMLFVTFLQVPIGDITKFLLYKRFIVALVIANFVVIPLFVGILSIFIPNEPLIKLGILFVLLAPCIDYVVTFAHIGHADARSLLMATPLLLLLQLFLLPFYLNIFIGEQVKGLIEPTPFIHAFVWLILLPLTIAVIIQICASRSQIMTKTVNLLNILPVPTTALALFIVIIAILPQLKGNLSQVISVIPFYLLFAIFAPFIGWFVGRFFRVSITESRAIAFSAGTRNALVILPIAMAIADIMPILPAVIVTQTLVELFSELVYIYLIAKLGRSSK